jgi:hypothetical protein
MDTPVLPLILTAADEVYARCLWQYLRSVERCRLTHLYHWQAHDLGLLPQTRLRLEHRFAWCRFVTFDFAKWPAHVGGNLRNYAWKPILVAEAVRAAQGPVLWFDSATLFRAAPDPALEAIRRDGLWYLRGYTSLASNTDPRTLDALDVPLELRHLPEIVSGALGVDAGDPMARDLVLGWKAAALQPGIIAPAPAPMVGHNFDQSVLGALIFKQAWTTGRPLQREEIDISSSRPVRFMTSRNKVRSWVPTWADPLVRAYYGSYKWADVRWLRFSRAANRLLGGVRRHVLEHFVVTLIDPGIGKTVTVPSPPYGYLADPFLWAKGPDLWLFAEEYRARDDRGHLVCLALDKDLTVQGKTDLKVINPDAGFEGHASFPFLFEHGGQVYMIPETSQRRSVDLYVNTRWPEEWRLVRRLLGDIDAADTTAMLHDARWWLLTSVRQADSGPRHLAIYSTFDLLRAPLVPHPVTAERRDLAQFGTGRSGGLVRKCDDGSWLRYVQSGDGRYATGGRFRRITKLTPDQFGQEDCADGDPDLPQGLGLTGHHLSTAGGVYATDHRSRWQARQFFMRWKSGG